MRRGGDGWDRTLDAVGREIERTALDGSVLGAYTYDIAGRMTSAIAPRHGSLHRVPVGRHEPSHPGHRRHRARARSSATPTGGPSRSPTRPGSAPSSNVTTTAASSACVDGEAGEFRLRSRPSESRPRPGGPTADRPRRHGLPLRRLGTSRRDRATGHGRRPATSTARRTRVARGRTQRAPVTSPTTPPAACGRSPSPGSARRRSTTTPPADARRDRSRRHRHASTAGTPSTSWSRSGAPTPTATTSRVRIDLDALGRPQRINDQVIGYDPLSGRPTSSVTSASSTPVRSRGAPTTARGVAPAATSPTGCTSAA